MLKSEFKQVGAADFGITENKFNNFLIDMFAGEYKSAQSDAKTFQYLDAVTGEVKESNTPISATVQLK